MISYIIVGIISYLIGSIMFSVIISKKMAGFDVRDKGSGNAGTTNMLRSVGKRAALITLIFDVFKGIVAVSIAFTVGNIVNDIDKALLIQIAGFLVIFGHTFPIFYKFKGGKGIATALGVLLIINWQIALMCLVFALILMAITRMVSVGSIATAVLLPILVFFIDKNFIVSEGSSYLIFSILLAVLVIFNHRKNIKRLIEGNENRISFGKVE